ncbi:ribbon-helix-helix protein, CopG family [Microbacterium capsulatum]|uniref:Ribbon-helix-helix protein, CopG family n=1 Tax=Microbacterium capsulatum TaxID=3041921 RepID=A0ABU0XIC0_9MICO|nr:ribbon-helix-helix protein, CopG family [Microbacterium sp. ASV81]MDQ4214851.1 ribbon-helix-helix protein, CopG family [Microbacterium sp. ASV81]
MKLTRTQISLSDDDRRVLDAVSRRTGSSMSALIREAIHSTYGDVGDPERLRGLIDASFGTIAREVSGEELVDGLRSGRRLSGLA